MKIKKQTEKSYSPYMLATDSLQLQETLEATTHCLVHVSEYCTCMYETEVDQVKYFAWDPALSMLALESKELMQNHITNKRVRVCENRKNTMQ
jgi:hypothetical protein